MCGCAPEVGHVCSRCRSIDDRDWLILNVPDAKEIEETERNEERGKWDVPEPGITR